ncbi:MAG: HEAT repeat domain-containing protein [Thermosynechococcaceae cyanobacterium]
MELPELETYLDSPDPQCRMKALVELRAYEPDQVVPLLKRRIYDDRFMIRALVAAGLGHKRNSEGFEVLLTLLGRETDYNVIAEAASSLSKFGSQAIPHLVKIFENQAHWLVRISILAGMEDIDSPETLLHLCRLGLSGDNSTVKEAAIANLARLKETPQMAEAVELACQLAKDSNASMRAQAARLLRYMGGPQAETALDQLRQDQDAQVMKAVLEGLL